MFWTGLLIVLAILIIWGIWFQIAYADYYEVIKLQFKSTPNICIFEPDPALVPDFYKDGNVYDQSRSAIHEWETKLSGKSENLWKFQVLEYTWGLHAEKDTSEFPNCNVFMIFEKELEGETLGYTSYDYKRSSHQYAWVVTSLESWNQEFKIIITGNPRDIDSEENNVVKFEVKRKPLPMSDVRNIILHELGHGLFGLGHYKVTTSMQDCKNDLCNDKSLMVSSFKPFQGNVLEVQDVDVEMVFELFGDKGFNKKFLIPEKCWIEGEVITKCEIKQNYSSGWDKFVENSLIYRFLVNNGVI